MIGEKIREARMKKEWTQDILAFKLKVTRNTVSKWERNKQEPTKEMQKKLERILKIKLAEEEKTTHKSQKKNSIKNRIQQARKEKKLTQKELASKLGVSASSISSWENNKSTPNAEMQEKFKQELYSFSYFMGPFLFCVNNFYDVQFWPVFSGYKEPVARLIVGYSIEHVGA